MPPVEVQVSHLSHISGRVGLPEALLEIEPLAARSVLWQAMHGVPGTVLPVVEL